MLIYLYKPSALERWYISKVRVFLDMEACIPCSRKELLVSRSDVSALITCSRSLESSEKRPQRTAPELRIRPEAKLIHTPAKFILHTSPALPCSTDHIDVQSVRAPRWPGDRNTRTRPACWDKDRRATVHPVPGRRALQRPANWD